VRRFAGKVAVITGGATGIGFAASRRFHAEGAVVVMAGRRTQEGDSAVAEIGSARAVFKQTDVTEREQLDDLYRHTVKQFGRLDIVVNNAGAAGFGPVATLQSKHWHRIQAVNLHALFESCQAALPHLLATIADDESASAAIVNVSSVSGMAGDHGLAAYNAAKAGALNFTRSLALELAPRRIRVNAISPGAVDTPLAAATSGTPVIAHAFRAAIPIGRFGRPEEIAAAIAFLAADEASFVIGANLAVDGGLTAGTGHPNMLTMFGDSWWAGTDKEAAQ
jgi:meso-butanediol dehydrogenase / (S,S)-butanediol dehydrogenase / diacetyl reductase